MTRFEKRIAIFLPNLGGGGAERMMVNLAKGLTSNGILVDLVLTNAVGPYIEVVQKEPRIRIVDLASSRVLTSIPGLVRYLRQESPDAILAALMHANIGAIIARRLSGLQTKVIISERNTLSQWVQHSGSCRARVMPTIMRWLYPLADEVVTVSHGVAHDLSKSIGLPKERMTVIYNPVIGADDSERSNVTSSDVANWRPFVLGVGRLTKQKDFPTLIRAFARVRTKTDLNLVILGEGEDRGEIERLVSELGIEDNVHVPGFVSNPGEYMSAASIFVLSSRWEGFGNVLVEAMACGAPVVSTDCPSGPSEILEDGKWGPLVQVGNSCEMAEAIENLIASRDNKLSVRLRQRASMFALDASVRAYQSILYKNGGA